VNGKRLARGWLIGGAALIALTVANGRVAGLAFPFLLSATGFLLLTRTRRTLRPFPSTDFERGLEQLFALLLPPRNTTTTASLRLAITQQARLAQLRRGSRRWGNELQLIRTNGYETTSRVSALYVPEGERDNRRLAAKAVQALKAERVRAGVDKRHADDPVTMLEDLLSNLGLAEDDGLRTHFDDVLAESDSTNRHPRNSGERILFRELAGAAFVLGASARILELAAPTSARETEIRLGAAGGR
jgi:hypothetical protein